MNQISARSVWYSLLVFWWVLLPAREADGNKYHCIGPGNIRPYGSYIYWAGIQLGGALDFNIDT